MIPNEPPSMVSLLDGVKRVEGVQLWNLLTDNLHT